MLPGKHYIADESNITEIKLVYLPRHPELIRNQNYDIKYLFKGIAHMGASEIGFSAYVDAVKLKS